MQKQNTLTLSKLKGSENPLLIIRKKNHSIDNHTADKIASNNDNDLVRTIESMKKRIDKLENQLKEKSKRI
jgi:hypothetical protein